MKDLKFIETLTIEQFKAKELVPTVQVRRNDATGKLFFTYGSKTGAVSTKGIPEHPVISLVQGDPTELNPTGEFYLLHNEGQGGAHVIATF